MAYFNINSIQGHPLQNVSEVTDAADLYDKLMNLILKFANHGVIHGDFNEFNIMVTDEGEPIIIDFPQMVSTAHKDAKEYFERDVNCVREFFRRRVCMLPSNNCSHICS